MSCHGFFFFKQVSGLIIAHYFEFTTKHRWIGLKWLNSPAAYYVYSLRNFYIVHHTAVSLIVLLFYSMKFFILVT